MKQKTACSWMTQTYCAVGTYPEARQLLRVMEMQRLLETEKQSKIVQIMFEYLAQQEKTTLVELHNLRARLNERNRLEILEIIIEDFIEFYAQSRSFYFASYNKTYNLNERRSHYISTINKGDCGLAALCISRVFSAVTHCETLLCMTDDHAFIKYGERCYDTLAQGWLIGQRAGEPTVGVLRTEIWNKFNGPDILGANIYFEFVRRWVQLTQWCPKADGFALSLFADSSMKTEHEEPQMQELIDQIPKGNLQAERRYILDIDAQTGCQTFKFDCFGDQY